MLARLLISSRGQIIEHQQRFYESVHSHLIWQPVAHRSFPTALLFVSLHLACVPTLSIHLAEEYCTCICYDFLLDGRHTLVRSAHDQNSTDVCSRHKCGPKLEAHCVPFVGVALRGPLPVMPEPLPYVQGAHEMLLDDNDQVTSLIGCYNDLDCAIEGRECI